MSIRNVDVVIIGTGTAGMSAYRAARAHTASVVLVERGVYGTTCARVGCMPSKLLIAAADAAHQVRHAAQFGIAPLTPHIDGAAVMQRVRAERDRFVGFVEATVADWPAADRVIGQASFIDAHTLAIDGVPALRAGRIVIATGSQPKLPAGWREALGARLVTTDDIFYWETLPAAVAVIGSGTIGLELGLALQRLGVRVRLFDRGGRFGGLSDPGVSQRARALLAEELPMASGARIERVSADASAARIDYQIDDKAISEQFDCVLVAIGREPNLAALNLAAAGITLDARGVPQSAVTTARIGSSHVFIAGDAAARNMILHEAADDGRVAGDNAGRYPDVRPRPRRAGLAISFTDPQIAVAGRSHAALVAAGSAFVSAEFDFSDQGRSRVAARNRGYLRVYGEPVSGRFLGAEMIAPDAEHLGHLLAWAAQAGLTVQQMLDSPFYHPVVEEGVRTALRSLQRALHLANQPIENCLDCAPGA